MLTVILSIIVGIIGFLCALGVYTDYRTNRVPPFITIPFMVMFIILGAASWLCALGVIT